MVTVFGDLLDGAATHLGRAAASPSPEDGAMRARAIGELESLAAGLAHGLGLQASGPAADGLVTHLQHAVVGLRTAREVLPRPEGAGAPEPLVAHLLEARQAVAAAMDTWASHTGPDQTPLTPYADLLSTPGASAYLARRGAELAREMSTVLPALERGGPPEAEGGLVTVRVALSRAAAAGSSPVHTAHAHAALDALPLAPALATAVSALSVPVLDGLGDDGDRLSRIAFETGRGAGRQISGSDLNHLGRWSAMGRLLAGRILLHAAATGSPALAEGVRQAADHLRTAARAWQETAYDWYHLVDLGDPRALPPLPVSSYEARRAGHVVPLPHTVPHQVSVTAHASVMRLGQLLYGPGWQPDRRRPEPRPAAAVAADGAGLGPLAAAFSRAGSVGTQLAGAASGALTPMRPGLVTDSLDHRPPALPPTQRFYPAVDRQLRKLRDAYEIAAAADHAAAGVLRDLAGQAGTPTLRAALDSLAEQHTRATAAGSTTRVSTAAARARSTTGSGGGRAVVPATRTGPASSGAVPATAAPARRSPRR